MMNRTLLYGEGFFETMRLPISENRLRLHYQRLRRSAEFFGIPCPDYEEFKVDCMLDVKEDSYLKFCLISKGEDYYGGGSKAYGKLVVLKRLRAPEGPTKLGVSPYRRHSLDPICRHKSTNYLFNVIVKKHALRGGFYDGVVLNERDEVCETSSANLLFLKGSLLYTPAQESGRLEGTTLSALKSSMDIREERIKISQLENFEAVFIINALVGCLPTCVEGFSLRPLSDLAEEIKKVWYNI